MIEFEIQYPPRKIKVDEVVSLGPAERQFYNRQVTVKSAGEIKTIDVRDDTANPLQVGDFVAFDPSIAEVAKFDPSQELPNGLKLVRIR